MVLFTWRPYYEELADRILEYRDRQGDLIEIVRKISDKGLPTIKLTDFDKDKREMPLAGLDPFSFYANFNRKTTAPNRIGIARVVKEEIGLRADVPSDFNGIPVAHPMQSIFFPFAYERDEGDIPALWDLARVLVEKGLEGVPEKIFQRCLTIRMVGIAKLTMGLFWLRPGECFALDSKNRKLLDKKGLLSSKDTITSVKDYQGIVRAVREHLGDDFPSLSYGAWVAGDEEDALEPEPESDVPPVTDINYWLIAPGENARLWDEWQKGGSIAIGWDELGDLKTFSDKEAIRREFKANSGKNDSSFMNDVTACHQFAHVMKPGDIVYVKKGIKTILGRGIVVSEYEFDSRRMEYQHRRRVKWTKTGEWPVPEGFTIALKTLTCYTGNWDFIGILERVLGDAPENKNPDRPRRYWWLNANPKIWNFASVPIGAKQTYTSHGANGNKRKKYKCFQEAAAGDLVVGYVTSPQREIVALCRITKGLHDGERGESIEFEKVESLVQPIPLETLQAEPDLAQSEPLLNHQGSLFPLTEGEFETIQGLIDELDSSTEIEVEIEPFDLTKAHRGLFMTEGQFNEMLFSLKERKNIILQGAPGVGKTFVARRLAFALVGSNDPTRMVMIQFHQSYSYEDFIQGYRPTAAGQFALRHGIFYQFCLKAQRDEADGKPYVFIIDEINRGNLSKIFGELMMLVEVDKRGAKFAMPLTYSEGERFYIPANVHFIGMMNTADRSLALVDYALRRRFRFITLRPEFGSPAFREYLIEKGAPLELARRVVDRITTLNGVIAGDTRNLGPGYQIGHSYFCLADGTSPDEAWYRRVVENEIVPLIQEYWFDNDDRVKEHRGNLLA